MLVSVCLCVCAHVCVQERVQEQQREREKKVTPSNFAEVYAPEKMASALFREKVIKVLNNDVMGPQH